jgi:hypothetical protein
MGNNHAVSSISKHKSSYYSVEYLSGSNCSEKYNSSADISANNEAEYEILGSECSSYLNLAFSSNPMGISKSTKNGTVQRSKSYVRPENYVLPSEIPRKPLKQTNLLQMEDLKKTWRKSNSINDNTENNIFLKPNLINNKDEFVFGNSNCDICVKPRLNKAIKFNEVDSQKNAMVNSKPKTSFFQVKKYSQSVHDLSDASHLMKNVTNKNKIKFEPNININVNIK